MLEEWNGPEGIVVLDGWSFQVFPIYKSSFKHLIACDSSLLSRLFETSSRYRLIGGASRSHVYFKSQEMHGQLDICPSDAKSYKP